MNLRLVRINSEYCDYLRQFDSRVPYNKGTKKLRPFIGVLFKINEIEYFAPLSSPKPKYLKMKDYIDFMKLDNGKLGAVNFNNMIPVTNNNYTIIDLNAKNGDNKYLNLLNNQYIWLNKNRIQLNNKSSKLYKYYIDNILPYNIKNRCCNFKLLETKCLNYNKGVRA